MEVIQCLLNLKLNLPSTYNWQIVSPVQALQPCKMLAPNAGNSGTCFETEYLIKCIFDPTKMCV